MSHPARLRVVLVLVLLAGGVAAHGSDEPPIQRDLWKPLIVGVFSKVWNLFLPFGQEIDPNGGHSTSGGTPTPSPGDSYLGHEIDPNG